jgi:hypothetical protein
MMEFGVEIISMLYYIMRLVEGHKEIAGFVNPNISVRYYILT